MSARFLSFGLALLLAGMSCLVTASARPGLLYLTLEDCPLCAQFEQQVLSDAAVRDRLDQQFNWLTHALGQGPVALPDGRQVAERELLQALRIYGTPALVYLSAAGEVVLVQQGARDRSSFLRALDYVQQAGYQQAPFSLWQAEQL